MRQGALRAVLGYLQRIANPDGGPDDAQLLDRWRDQRDPAAFELLIWRHGTMVWNVCQRTLGHSQDVEDAFQATFLTFLRKADTIGRGECLGSWLYKVASRIALVARTSSARHTGHEEMAADLPAASTEVDGWDELRSVLDEEINRLPEKYRRPFVLCYLEGKTTDEAARDLGWPRGTVGTRLAWARERLRVRLTRRGLMLSAAALAALLSQKAAAGSVPASLVASTVQAATVFAAGKALAGVISVRAVALTGEVARALFLTKLESAALVLLVAGLLGGGAGPVVHRALVGATETTSSPEEKELLAHVEDRTPPNQVAARGDRVPGQGRTGNEFAQHLSGTVVRVDRDGKGIALEIPSKVEGEVPRRIDLALTDRTLLTFSTVGPNEARLTEGYRADVWLERDSKDVVARLFLTGNQKIKNSPDLACPVVAVAADGKEITLEKPAKGRFPAQKRTIQLTESTRVSFVNVARDGARMTVGYSAMVWLEKDSPSVAKAVTFFGTAEPKTGEGKEQKADRTGKIVALSANGQILTVEVSPAKGKERTSATFSLTDATRESYHGVAVGGARPAVGYQVQVWLAPGSTASADRVRFSQDDPRKSLDARILAASTDGSRLSVEVPPRHPGGQATTRELAITPRTRLVFFDVGPGGARPVKGDHVRARLLEGLEDVVDELMVSRSEKPDARRYGP